MTLTCDILRPAELSARDRAAWSAIRAQRPEFDSPLLSVGFADMVGRVRGDTAVAVYRRVGQAVGFLAHQRRPGGFARPIGAPFSDYHALISEPGAGLDGESALKAAGLKVFRYTGLIDPDLIFGASQGDDEGNLITLTGSAEDYVEGLRQASPKKFKNWRRLHHKMERELGDTRIEEHPPGTVFNQLVSWKRDQFVRTRRHDFLRNGWARELMEQVHASDGEVRGYTVALWSGDRFLCGHFGLREGDRFHPWIASMDPDLTAYSPGQSFLSEMIKAMPRLGLRTYDMGPGHDHYKGPFCSGKRAISVGSASVAAGRAELKTAGSRVFEKIVGPERAGSFARRMEHVAQIELSLAGRALGFAGAVAGRLTRGPAEAGAEA